MDLSAAHVEFCVRFAELCWIWSRGFFKKITVLVLPLAIGACGADSVSDGVSLQEVASRNQGVAIMFVETPLYFSNCNAFMIEVRRQDISDGPVRTIQIKNGFHANGMAQKRLEAGQYAIINFICHAPKKHIYLQRTPGMFSPDRPHFKYGLFDVRQGEVVNIGQISIALGFGHHLSKLTVQPFTQEQLQWLAENRPQLSARMVTRLMRPIQVL